MTVTTASGTRVFIGAAVTQLEADTLPEFEAMSAWTEVGEVESVGEFGDQANDVTFAALGDGRVRHSKGARDAGTMALVCGHDPLDVGQAAVDAAEQTKTNFAFRVILPDAPTPAYSNTIYYFRGLVASRRKNIGTNDNIIRSNYNVLISSELFTNLAHSV
jgi:Phage tail tube protein, TTP